MSGAGAAERQPLIVAEKLGGVQLDGGDQREPGADQQPDEAGQQKDNDRPLGGSIDLPQLGARDRVGRGGRVERGSETGDGGHERIREEAAG